MGKIKILVIILSFVSALVAEKDDALSLNDIYIDNNIALRSLGPFKQLSNYVYVRRNLDLEKYFERIHQLYRHGIKLEEQCKSEKPSHINDEMRADLNFLVIKGKNTGNMDIKLMRVTQETAKKICEAEGMMLPEILTSRQMDQMVQLMRTYNIKAVFAGIQFNYVSYSHKFISTGFPFEEGYYREAENLNTSMAQSPATLHAHPHIQFVYSQSGLQYYQLYPKLKTQVQNHIDFEEWRAKWYGDIYKLPIICQPKLVAEGLTYLYDYNSQNFKHDRPYDFNSIEKRVLYDPENKDRLAFEENHEKACNQLAQDLKEKSISKALKMVRLLNLNYIAIEDPTLQWQREKAENLAFDTAGKLVAFDYNQSSRKKRFVGLGLGILSAAKFAMTASQFYRGRKLKTRVENVEETAMMLTKEISDHSLAIRNLELASNEMDKRKTTLQSHYAQLKLFVKHNQISILKNQMLSTYRQEYKIIDEGLTKEINDFEDIVLGLVYQETSFKSLTADDFARINREIKIETDFELETNFRHIDSLMYVDAYDRTQVTLGMRIPSVRKNSFDVVEITPIPVFQEHSSYLVKIPYKYFGLSKDKSKYFEIHPGNVEQCLTSPCLINSPIKDTLRQDHQHCGVNLYFATNQNINCDFEVQQGTPDFFQVLQPNGIVYATAGTIQLMIICPSGKTTMEKKFSLQRTGVIQIPPTCEGLAQGTHTVTLPGPPGRMSYDADEIRDLENKKSDYYLRI